MKRILTGTALVLLMSTTAMAGTTTGKLETYQMDHKSDIYASKFIGMRVYAAEKDYDMLDQDAMIDEGKQQEWDDIGEVNDVILSRDGQVKAVILGVGGFIGIGEKDVAVQMRQVKLIREKDDDGEVGDDDFFLVINANKQSLTDAETYERHAMVDTRQPVTETTEDPKDRTRLMAPDVRRDGYREVKDEELTTEDLTGARVYGSNDEDVGEIDRLIVDDQGKIKRAIIDVGGFLGIGEHSIAVTMKELRILRTENGDDFRVYIDATQAELEKQPAYKG